MSLYHAVLAVDRDSGEIPNVLVGSRQLVEEGRLAAVLVSHESECQSRAFRQGILSLLLVVSALFTEARMLRLILSFIRFILHSGALMYRYYLYLLCIRNTKGQLVPVYAHFDRIAHGSKLYELYLGSRYDSHVQQMLAKSSLSSDRFYDR